MKTSLRVLALALFCAGIAALLALRGVAAQTPTDYDTDNDGLIEVDSLAKLNAMRWDLNGDGVVDPVDANQDGDTTDPGDVTATTANQVSYAAAFTNWFGVATSGPATPRAT